MSPEKQALVIAFVTLIVSFFGTITGTSIAYLQLRRTPRLDTEAQISDNALIRAA